MEVGVTENSTKLTEEQYKEILDATQESIDSLKGTPLGNLMDMPSNHGVEEVPEEERKPGEHKMMNVMVDPNTGEHKVIGPHNSDEDTETFEEMCERLEKTDFDFEIEPISEKDLIDYISKTENNSILAEMIEKDPDVNLKADTVQKLLQVVNRRINKENFNVYKELPEESQNLINQYMIKSGIPILAVEGKRIRNELAENLIEDFVQGVSTDRAIYDFNKEFENMMMESQKMVSEITNDYILERNRKLRERIESIDPEKEPEKREKGLQILEAIDEAYNLTKLKEFSKRCKIKKIELEKPNRIFDQFLDKYRESKYNIYDIKLTRPILFRHLNEVEPDGYTDRDINALLLCFCKQCLNMKAESTLENLYMYNMIFNIIWLDIKKKAQKVDTNGELYIDGYLNNIIEVIENLRERNGWN